MSDQNWIDLYYKTESKKKRLSLLEENADPDSTETKIRKKLWDVRYGKRGKASGEIDYFIKGIYDILTESRIPLNFFNGRGKQRTMNQIAKDLCLIDSDLFTKDMFEDSALVEKLLYDEYKALAIFYFHMSFHDSSYSTAIMGLGNLKEEQIIEKLANDVKTICIDAPKNFQLEKEFATIRTAFFDAFKSEYPDYEELLE